MSSLSSVAAPAPAAGPPLRLSNLGDELLARYAARGSDRAFAALYERYHQRLYRYCRSIVRDDTDAQDALQSTFAAALAALRRGQRNAPLRPWLYKIAHNEAISLLRRRTRDAGDELHDESFVVGYSVEQEVADRARWRTLVADLGGLPDRQRGALLLRELSGLSHEEIAIALGTTIAGAKQAIFEARQALAEIEEGRTMSCEEVRRRISEGDRRVLRGRKVSAHLRECAACDAFAMAIPARRAELRAFTPVLPPAVAAALLSRSLHTGSASAGAGAGGSSAAVAAGVAGKAAGTALVWKALAGVAVIATTAAGVTGIPPLLHHSSSSAPAAAVKRDAGASGARGKSALTHQRAGRSRSGADATKQGSHHAAAQLNHVSRAGGDSSSYSQAAAAGNHFQSKTFGHRSSHSRGTRGHSVSAPGHQPIPQGLGSHGHSSSAPGHQPIPQGQSSHAHSTSAPGHQPAPAVPGSSAHSSTTSAHQAVSNTQTINKASSGQASASLAQTQQSGGIASKTGR